MKLNIRPLEVSDYDNILVDWWADWRWTAPSRDFMYLTNSKAAWCDWIISNLHYKDRNKRKEALALLVGTITKQAEDLNKKYVYALIKNKPLINVYKKIGYEEASTYSIEMIKKI